MGPVWRRLIGLFALLPSAVAARTAGAGQADTQPSSPLPPPALRQLDSIEDFSFSFAQPGFYAVLEYVRAGGTIPEQPPVAIRVDDWRRFLERPADFRGMPVIVEGVVGRNSAWRHLRPPYRDLGTLWQIELRRRGQPIACTLILTAPAGDIPVGSTIRVAGLFVMVRRYYDAAGRKRQAALLVARGPTLVQTTGRSEPTTPPALWSAALVVAIGGLLVVWLLLRRRATRSVPRLTTLKASRPAPFSVAEDLARWAADESDDAAPEADENDGSDEGLPAQRRGPA